MKNILRCAFFTYGRAVRAYRLDGQGKPIPEQFKGENMENALQIGYDNPEIAIAFANLQKWNQSLVDFAVKTGVLNDEQAKIWLGTLTMSRSIWTRLEKWRVSQEVQKSF